MAKRLPLIKPSNHILMSLGPVSRVHVLEEEEGVVGWVGGSRSQWVPRHQKSKLNLIINEILTIVIVYSCFRDFMVLSSMTTIPPPSTVSTVLAKRLGVRASKSCVTRETIEIKQLMHLPTLPVLKCDLIKCTYVLVCREQEHKFINRKKTNKTKTRSNLKSI